MASVQPRRSLHAPLASGARILQRLGVVLLALAAVFALHTWLTTHSLLRAEATVSENVATQDATGVVHYTSRLHFRLPDGRSIVIDDPHRSTDADRPDYPTGEILPVAYTAGHPEQARIATVWRLYHAACLSAITGTLLFDIGLIVLLRLKRRRG